MPKDIAGICGVVQSLLIHDYFGQHLYAAPPAGMATASRRTLPVAERLAQVEPGPLSAPRAPAARYVGTCRDFALLTCALLRHHGVAARLRCGFARYFHPPTHEDHWVCEYRDGESGRWHLADAQLDDAHRAHLKITFDPCDLPDGAFLFPWQVLHRFGAREDRLAEFGHGDAVGGWFLRVNLARDLLALSGRVASDWDTWRDQRAADRQMTPAAWAECNEMAAAARDLSTGTPPDYAAAERIYAAICPPHWQCARIGAAPG